MSRFYALGIALCLTGAAAAADWPGWMGPSANGTSGETGLLTTWPSTGPKVLWKVDGGEGYSSIAVAQGKAVTLVQKDGQEFAVALDAVKGTQLWKTPIAKQFKNSYGNGPRSTPTLEGNRVWIQSVSGVLACLDLAKGDVVWTKNIMEEFKAKQLPWGLSASPTIDGDRLYVLPGDGGGMVALNKADGKLLWHKTEDKAGYATPVVTTVGGKKQVIFFTAAHLTAVAPEDGKEIWRLEWPTEYDCNIATPLVISGDRLFVTSGEKVGCTLFQLKANEAPSVIWESKGPKSVMINFWANSVAVGDYLYGLNGEFDRPIHLDCVDLKTGKTVWSQKKFGKGALTFADGHLFISTKDGDLVLVAATPEKYIEKGRIRLLGDNRTVPTLANKRLYLRDKEKIVCIDAGAGD